MSIVNVIVIISFIKLGFAKSHCRLSFRQWLPQFYLNINVCKWVVPKIKHCRKGDQRWLFVMVITEIPFTNLKCVRFACYEKGSENQLCGAIPYPPFFFIVAIFASFIYCKLHQVQFCYIYSICTLLLSKLLKNTTEKRNKISLVVAATFEYSFMVSDEWRINTSAKWVYIV